MASVAKTALISALLFSASTSVTHAQSKLSAVDAFVASSNALAKAANERIDLGRASVRLTTIKAAFTEALQNAQLDKTFQIALSTNDILCDSRAMNIEVVARRNYMQTLAARVEEVGTPSKIDTLASAAKVLFGGQSLEITTKIDSKDDLDKAVKAVSERCDKDLKNFTEAFYGKKLLADEAGQSAGAVFAALSALYDIFVNIVTPVVVDGAKIVDDVARQKVIFSYLNDPNRRAEITTAGQALATEISRFTLNKRLQLAGGFNEKLALVNNVKFDPSKNDNCKAFLSNHKIEQPKNSLNESFVLCWRAVWTQGEDAISSALKAADGYDQLADAGDTDNARKAFEPIAAALAQVEKADKDVLAKIWNAATRLIAFSQKIEAAASKENRQKIEKAIDDLVKSI